SLLPRSGASRVMRAPIVEGEEGIRHPSVSGVQTCGLPILCLCVCVCVNVCVCVTGHGTSFRVDCHPCSCYAGETICSTRQCLSTDSSDEDRRRFTGVYVHET